MSGLTEAETVHRCVLFRLMLFNCGGDVCAQRMNNICLTVLVLRPSLDQQSDAYVYSTKMLWAQGPIDGTKGFAICGTGVPNTKC